MSKISNVHLITGLNAGGAEMMVYKTVSNLDKEKYTPIVISLLSPGPISELIKNEKIELYHLNMSKNILSILKVFIQLIILLRKIKPTILHTYMFHADILGRITGRLTKVPIIISSIRNENIGGRLRELFMQYTDPLTDSVTAVCWSAGKAQINKGTTRMEKLNVIYNGIDLKKFKKSNNTSNNLFKYELGIPEDNNIIITVGRIEPQKNHEQLISAFSKVVLKNPHCNLVIVGDGYLKQGLIEMVKENPLIRNNVHFVGLRNDIPDLLSIADLFVLSSKWEGMPNVLLEAMAMQLPVISTNVGGAAEFVDKEVGILIPPDSESELVKSILTFFELSVPERISLGKKGFERVKSSFTIEKTLEETDRLYSRLIENKVL